MVYRHIYDNQVVYIGMGKPGRENDKGSRSKEWRDLIKNLNSLTVEVLWETESRIEAYEKEKEFISLYGRRELSEGTLLNKTDGGGWLKGAKWSEEKRQAYSNRARECATLKKWQKQNGAATKGKKLPKHTKERIATRVAAVKAAWKKKTEEERNLQIGLFITNNPSYWIQECGYCGKSIRGASAFKRFHGQNCKQNNKTLNI